MKSCPDVGQLVFVRKRPFVVTEIVTSALPTKPLANDISHLIKLSSVEDDGLGEELQVIWEIEPGTKVHEKSTVPKRQGVMGFVSVGPTNHEEPRWIVLRGIGIRLTIGGNANRPEHTERCPVRRNHL